LSKRVRWKYPAICGRGCRYFCQSESLTRKIWVRMPLRAAVRPSTFSSVSRNLPSFSMISRACLPLREVTMTKSPVSYFTNLPMRGSAACALATASRTNAMQRILINLLRPRLFGLLPLD
jgi:hypothetical protein